MHGILCLWRQGVAFATLLILSVASANSVSSPVTIELDARATGDNLDTACNGYTEFCKRRYSNVTEVCAHNSPFAEKGNPASNQDFGVLTQLEDGIRMLQGQVHILGDTLYLCHSACILLNAGTLEDYLSQVASWLKDNPHEVITILMGNADRIDVQEYVAPLENSGIAPYLYVPPKKPMFLDDWPTLLDMITENKRIVFFLDYGADEDKVPFILNQFSHMWETPFSPTDLEFPCTVQRPSSLSAQGAGQRMYIANHNLNILIEIRDIDILVPNIFLLRQTNAESGAVSLGDMAEDCTDMWNRPPNFLLVDYYNIGDGSVFKVAARMNGVEYVGNCCGGSSDDQVIDEDGVEGEESRAAKVVDISAFSCFIFGFVLTMLVLTM